MTVPVHFTETAKTLIAAKGLDIKEVADWIIEDVQDQMHYDPAEDGDFKPELLIIGSTPLTKGFNLFSEEGFWAVAGRADGLHVDVGTWTTFNPPEGFPGPSGAVGDDIPAMAPQQFESIENMFDAIFGGKDEKKQ
jgi:hypothetical protein